MRLYPYDSAPYILSALSQVFEIFHYLTSVQGKVVWLQNLASMAEKGTLSTLWRSITERQISIIEDGISLMKKDHVSLREIAVMHYFLLQAALIWQECVSDAIHGVPLRSEWEGQPTWKQILHLWQRCLADCGLSQTLNRRYLQYQMILSGANNIRTNALSLSSIAPSTTTGLRSLVAFFCNKLIKDTKNTLIARSLSRLSGGSFFSGRSSMSIPPRLQVWFRAYFYLALIE